MQTVNIYADGSAMRSRDGSGGYGTIIQYINDDGIVEKTEEYTEGFAITTNNRMELMGAIKGMESLENPSIVTLYSDSKYVIEAFNSGWIYNWMKNGWITSTKKKVSNIDLWRRLLDAMKPHDVSFVWIKGHDGNELNERCDFLAQSSAAGIKFKADKDGILHELDLNTDQAISKLVENDILIISKMKDEENRKFIKVDNVKFTIDENGKYNYDITEIRKSKLIYKLNKFNEILKSIMEELSNN